MQNVIAENGGVHGDRNFAGVTATPGGGGLRSKSEYTDYAHEHGLSNPKSKT